MADEITPLWQFTEKELDRRDAPPPYWAFAWVGGQALARYLLDGTEDLAGRHVLDVGSGSGLCAIAAAKAGALTVAAADVDPFSHVAIAMNAGANGVQIDCIAEDVLAVDPPRIDVVLAGDVFYERELSGRALAWLEAAHLNGARVLIGDPGRPHCARHRLTQVAEYRVPSSLQLEDAEVKLAGVFTFPACPTGLDQEEANFAS